ncbi:MAG TPA: hypothetical protein VIA18_19245 [Polyangia bacterium]|jgi:hypothetical protein|nr:hypothetical protein [Polyangia bacterium]HWE29251.1 hypothetical protein [Polyangia bacterium]
MRSLLVAAAVVALFLAAGACGSQITVPDQGVIVLGCRTPSFCYRVDCDCLRASTVGPPDDNSPGGVCVITAVCDDNLPPSKTDDPGSCYCPAAVPVDMAGVPAGADLGPPIDVQCQEPQMLCVGRGPVCTGGGAHCLPAGSSDCSADGDPPQLVPVDGQPTLEPRCQYTDDVCCPGTELDAGIPETD